MVVGCGGGPLVLGAGGLAASAGVVLALVLPEAGEEAPSDVAGMVPEPKGHVYNNNDGIAIECQNYPDGPNKPDYPNCILRPGEVFEQAIIYAFGIR